MENNNSVFLKSHIETTMSIIKDNPKLREYLLRFNMPYVFQQLSDSNMNKIPVDIPLNRNYKPLGVLTNELVDYSAITLYNIPAITYCDDNGHLCYHESFYLYQDGNAPWLSKKDYNNYIARLRYLLQ